MDASLFFDNPEADSLYNKSYALDKPEVTLGRAPDRDISIPFIFCDVSRDHCSFYRDNGSLSFRDYSSTGTSVNDKRVSSGNIIPLRDGDRLTFGNHLGARVVMRRSLIEKLTSFFK